MSVWLTAEQLAHKRAEARILPYLEALHETLATIGKAMNVNTSDLVIILPLAPEDETAIALLGCDVIHADVPAPMVAVRARSTVRIETEG